MTDERKCCECEDRNGGCGCGGAQDCHCEGGRDGTVDGPGWRMTQTPKDKVPEEMPTLDFSRLCISLGTAALMGLGVVPQPGTQKVGKDLAMARQNIDILAILEEKTKGNLTPAEDELLKATLYDLRMAYLAKVNEG